MQSNILLSSLHLCVAFVMCRVLKAELDTVKIKLKVAQEENRSLKQASVIIVCISL